MPARAVALASIPALRPGESRALGQSTPEAEPGPSWDCPPALKVGSDILGRSQRTTLHKTPSKNAVVVAYQWHPLWKQTVELMWVQQFEGRKYAVCRLPDGTRYPMPAWMLDVPLCSLHSQGEPMLSLHALCELRRVVDFIQGSGVCDGSGKALPQEDSLGTQTNSSAAASVGVWEPKNSQSRDPVLRQTPTADCGGAEHPDSTSSPSAARGRSPAARGGR